jgi:hypothetical protein
MCGCICVSAYVCVWQAVIAAEDRRAMWVVVKKLMCGYVLGGYV